MTDIAVTYRATPTTSVVALPTSHSDADIARRQDPRTRCPECFGEGWIKQHTGGGLNDWVSRRCPECAGTGYAAETRAALAARQDE